MISSPRSAAAWRAVRPAMSTALTSAPARMSAVTFARSPPSSPWPVAQTARLVETPPCGGGGSARREKHGSPPAHCHARPLSLSNTSTPPCSVLAKRGGKEGEDVSGGDEGGVGVGERGQGLVRVALGCEVLLPHLHRPLEPLDVLVEAGLDAEAHRHVERVPRRLSDLLDDERLVLRVRAGRGRDLDVHLKQLPRHLLRLLDDLALGAFGERHVEMQLQLDRHEHVVQAPQTKARVRGVLQITGQHHAFTRLQRPIEHRPPSRVLLRRAVRIQRQDVDGEVAVHSDLFLNSRK
mmetsp:Transcript_17732/g.43009  ORF Transcript_17732/g.43009 Transcript_17732/m.43009 type:complete len:294 (-) Transcript_17732:384-1265(-)